MADVYSMLMGNTNQGSPSDYFLKWHEAQQNYNFNQQAMAQRAQQMQFSQQLQPLELSRLQAGIDATKQSTSTNRTQQQGMRQDQKFSAEMQPIEMQNAELLQKVRSGQISQQEFDLERARINAPLDTQNKQLGLTVNRQTIASNQLELDQQRADKKAAGYIKLGGLAMGAKDIGVEGSQERVDYIKNIMPQIKSLGLDDELDFETMAADGVSDAELEQVIQLSGALKNGQMTGADLMKAQEQMYKTQKAGLDVQKASTDLSRQKAQDKAAASSQMNMVDMSTNTVDELLNVPDSVWDDATGAFEGTSVGQAVTGNIFDQDVANLKATVKTLQSQLTLSNVDKLSGPASDADMRLLAESVQSIDLTQDTPTIKRKLQEVKRLNNKIRKDVAAKFRVENTVPDTPNAKATPEDFDVIMKGYGI